MAAKREIGISANDGISALRAFRYWERALGRSDECVDKPDEAREALKQIVTITPDAMAEWLRTYPNSIGWRRYKGSMRQSAYGREALSKLSVSKNTAARFRRLAKSQGLSQDEMLSRLLDGVRG
jgi:hypothetical protein